MKLDRSRIAWTVAILTFVSGSAITLLDANTVRSAQDDKTAPSAPAAIAQAPSQSQSQPQLQEASHDPSACLTDPQVLSEISRKKQDLDQKERDLAAKETELKAREAAINDEVKKLQGIRDEISGLQGAQKKQNADKVAKIVSTLEGMSPKSAAQMLTVLDDDLAVSAISQMSTTKLAKVMNTLDPKRAAKLSELLAGVVRARNSNASDGAAVATSTEKGGETNDQQHNTQNKQPESIISSGPEQFTGRGPASSGQGEAGTTSADAQ